MSISLSKIVQILPGVLAASGSALDVNGLILSGDTRIPTGAVLNFTTADDVKSYFGALSTEYTMAAKYFSGYNNASRLPGELLFAQYNELGVSAWLRSGSMASVTIAQLQAMSGTLSLSINNTTVTTGNINLSAVTSFAAAATVIENAINTVKSSAQVSVRFDTTQKKFYITTVSSGSNSAIGYASGTLSASLLLTSATGASLSHGANAAVVADLFTTILDQNQNWVLFTTSFMPTKSQGEALAAWVTGQNNRFAYILMDNSVYAVTSGSTNAYAYDIINTYNDGGTIPVYGTQEYAASLLAIPASFNFDLTNGRRSIAFRVQSGLASNVNTNADYSSLITNGYNFYGKYAANNIVTNQWYPGSITGSYKWIDAYIGQIWLNANLQSDIITLFQSEIYLPYNDAGRAAIQNCMTSTVEQFKSWGGISAGTTLDDNQILAINSIVGTDVSTSLTTKGYYIYIGPFTAAMRNARTSPTVYLWYCDGGFIQKLIVNSVEVQ
ncbi:DUF3383 domain-containing protein [Dickeya poaceiphila]|uniref:DUF3383 domain-containing protein n=1 Tax=Dickeya poaceiphila TaxID=568768 RepID=A0A5B8I4N7_9GAMM|nr:DUF3383 domain-containing protein [Dickeya poaceiphila]QDX29553.1 DUF3383 domain-containing protein [Dickeya poaceiphila]